MQIFENSMSGCVKVSNAGMECVWVRQNVLTSTSLLSVWSGSHKKLQLVIEVFQGL